MKNLCSWICLTVGAAIVSLACALSAAPASSIATTGVTAVPLATVRAAPDESVTGSILYPLEQARGDWTVCADEALNVRGGPREAGRVLRILERGERVRVREWWHGWAMVAPAEWVNGDYLCMVLDD